MFIQKNFTLKTIMNFAGFHLIWLIAWAVLVTLLHEFTHTEWLHIPWLPLSIIATAVAFYIGFKNNSAYDRLWEARKIWGAIVNSSRMWGSNVKNYVTNQFNDATPVSDQELKAIHQNLLYRHIAWLYTLRSQLLIPAPWEHISQSKHIRQQTERRRKRFGIGLFDDGLIEDQLSALLGNQEMDAVINYQNTATQLIDRQGQALRELRAKNLIDDFRHMELQKILNDFYTQQGQCERIKKFPFPRQYGGVSVIFVGVFIFLLPFGLVSEFEKIGAYGAWLSVPFTALISWIYLVMELVGDYSENPFEGMGNDIPMLALCRTIEIDLREMLGETELPPAIEAKNGVLM